MKRVCVFCGSGDGVDPSYRNLGKDVGNGLANSGLGVVYGGSAHGVMGAVADAALAAGGEVIGVLPTHLQQTREPGHPGITQLLVVPDMHARKAKMVELANAFLVLPGGVGTLEELFEVLCGAQIGLHEKPILIVNLDGYYDSLLAFLDTAVQAGFIRASQRGLLQTVASADAAVSRLVAAIN